MNYNEKILAPYFLKLLNKTSSLKEYKKDEEVAHLLNVNIKKLNAQQPLLDFDGIRKSNENYIKEELDWYLSQNLNVKNSIGKIALIWLNICDKEGFVNSNYGHRIFSKDCGFQYENCLNELIKRPTSRRAIMQYMPTTIYTKAFENGKNDFICTNYVHCFLEEVPSKGTYELHYIIHQRSCDIVYGMFNDFAWHCFVYDKLLKDLKSSGVNIDNTYEHIDWNIGTLHYYGRHLKVVKDIGRLWEEIVNYGGIK